MAAVFKILLIFLIIAQSAMSFKFCLFDSGCDEGQVCSFLHCRLDHQHNNSTLNGTEPDSNSTDSSSGPLDTVTNLLKRAG